MLTYRTGLDLSTARRGVGHHAHQTPRLSSWQRCYGASIRPTVKILARIHLGILRASRGKLGRRFFDGRVVLLTTLGRRSGRAWTTPLAYMKHGDSLVVAASCGGSDRPPDWWLNLQDQPRAVIEMSGVKSAVHAQRVESHALNHLTPQFEESFPQLHFYKRMSAREIPLVLLKPAAGTGVGNPASSTAWCVTSDNIDVGTLGTIPDCPASWQQSEDGPVNGSSPHR
jgi:deazaflavin-dependent oxidoreductase (nitroreductase family)